MLRIKYKPKKLITVFIFIFLLLIFTNDTNKFNYVFVDTYVIINEMYLFDDNKKK